MDAFDALGVAWADLSAPAAAGWGTAFFGALYVLLCGGTWWLTRSVLPTLRVGRRIDATPLRAGQIRRELAGSAVSVSIFGIGSVIPWWFVHAGWARLAVDGGALRVGVEILALLVWNDVHFYASHRLLHTRPLRRFHQQHHRSLVTTPFATYSFHPLEAALLGNVILLPMLVHDFSFAALLALPVLSLLLNNLGHSNYDVRPGAPADSWIAASRRHQLHHARYHGNYGFLFNFMDRWCGTRLPDADGRGCGGPRDSAA
ncbi:MULTISPECIES: sterol desaturase family protein [Luteimonas]|uniref:sterol desaturase family protein n=1 Tax=Luteimonas TaxID=83614 RepID=UPI000C7C81B0|nr:MULTISPECIES: sterol desaturase family protein [Luteimonas]